MGVWEVWFVRIFSSRILGSTWYTDMHFYLAFLSGTEYLYQIWILAATWQLAIVNVKYKTDHQPRCCSHLKQNSLSVVHWMNLRPNKNISWTNLVTYSDMFLKDLMWIWMQRNLKKWWNSWLVLFIPKVPNIYPSYIYQNRNIITSHMVIHLYLTVAEALFCLSLSPYVYLWMLP